MNNFDLKVGFYCNHNCVHCVVSNSAQYGNLSFCQVKGIVDNIPKNNSITLTGGEPTVRPDFIKIIELCRNHNHISVQTNGTGLTEEICERLRYYNASVLLTIHSSSEEVYIKTAQCPEFSFSKAISAAKNLTKYNINFTWQIVVHKINVDTVFETFLFAKSINKNVGLKLTYPDPAGNADNKDLLCTYTELQHLVDKVAKEFERSISFEGFPLCLLQKHKKTIYNARCHEEAKGINFSKNLAIEKYNMSERRTYIEICNSCICKPRCNGIYKKYIEYFETDEFKHIDKISTNENINNYIYQIFFYGFLLLGIVIALANTANKVNQVNIKII